MSESTPRKVLKVDDSVFEDVKVEAANTMPLDPYSLREGAKGEPTKPAKAELKAEDEKMEVSDLRADNTDDDRDLVSDSNLSDVQVCEEFPEVEEESTARILEKMGKSPSPGMVELCDDIVMMLHPKVTSTPKRSGGSSSSTASTHSSMPPLTDGWSGTSDSANDSSDVSPVEAVTAKDTVTVKLERNLLINNMLMINSLCSRTKTSPQSETQVAMMKNLMMMCSILHMFYTNYLLYLFRHPPPQYLCYVPISGANVLKGPQFVK